MGEMSNIEYYYLCKELQQVVGKHLRKLYELRKWRFRFRFDGTDIVCDLGKRMNITKYIEKAPAAPSGFVMGLRKKVGNATLTSVKQHKLDRVVVFTLQKGKEYSLVFEMFGKGNLILLDEDGVVISCYRREEWKDRKTWPKERYSFPSSPLLPLRPSIDDIGGALGDKAVASSLSRLPIGISYVKEALVRSGVDEKKPGEELTGREIRKIRDEVLAIVDNLKPVVYVRDGKILVFSLTELSKYKGEEMAMKESLSDAADDFYHQEDKGKRISVVGEGAEKLRKRLDSQKAALERLAVAEKEAKEAGDLIFKNSYRVERIIAFIRESRKRGAGWEEIEKKLSGQGVEVNRKRGTFTIDLQ